MSSAFVCYKRASLPIPTPAGRDVATSTYLPNLTRECVCLTSVVARVLPQGQTTVNAVDQGGGTNSEEGKGRFLSRKGDGFLVLSEEEFFFA